MTTLYILWKNAEFDVNFSLIKLSQSFSPTSSFDDSWDMERFITFTEKCLIPFLKFESILKMSLEFVSFLLTPFWFVHTQFFRKIY